jgi:DNA replication and repair protein RecF
MGIKSIALHNFRNHSSLLYSDLSSTVIIKGPNGAGKTNVLEAISLLAPGKGFKKGKFNEMLMHSPPTRIIDESAQASTANLLEKKWCIRYTIEDIHNRSIFEVAISHGDQANTERKQVKIDGESIKTQKILLDTVKTVWLTPEMYSSFYYSASNRRNFLDRIVYSFITSHADSIIKYNKLVYSRNKLLKAKVYDAVWIESIEEQIAIYAAEIVSNRAAVLDQINNFMLSTKWHHKPQITLQGKNFYINEPFDKERYLKVLQTNRYQEERTGRTLYGPHLDDINILCINKQLPSQYYSTGEQKNLITKVILGQLHLLAQSNTKPLILLLDDIFAHIDDTNSQLVLDVVESIPNVQKWISGTQDDLKFADSKAYSIIQLGL